MREFRGNSEAVQDPHHSADQRNDTRSHPDYSAFDGAFHGHRVHDSDPCRMVLREPEKRERLLGGLQYLSIHLLSDTDSR